MGAHFFSKKFFLNLNYEKPVQFWLGLDGDKDILFFLSEKKRIHFS